MSCFFYISLLTSLKAALHFCPEITSFFLFLPYFSESVLRALTPPLFTASVLGCPGLIADFFRHSVHFFNRALSPSEGIFSLNPPNVCSFLLSVLSFPIFLLVVSCSRASSYSTPAPHDRTLFFFFLFKQKIEYLPLGFSLPEGPPLLPSFSKSVFHVLSFVCVKS